MEQLRLDLLEKGRDSVRDSSTLETFVQSLDSDAVSIARS